MRPVLREGDGRPRPGSVAGVGIAAVTLPGSGGLSLLYGIGGVVVYNGPAILAWLARLMAA